MTKTITWKIDNFHCASCVKDIQDTLSKVTGVIEVKGDFISGQVSISYYSNQITVNALAKKLSKIGYPVIDSCVTTIQIVKNLLFKLSIAVVFIIILLSGWMDQWSKITKYTTLIFGNLIIMFWAGNHIYTRAYSALINKKLNMYSLVSISTLAAWIYSVLAIISPSWLTGSYNSSLFWDLPTFVISIIIFGEIIEKLATAKIQSSMKTLLNITIQKTRVIKKNQEIMTNTDLVQINDIILVKPEEKIPLDGIVQNGNSSVNEANLTGEAHEIHKTKGSLVYSGSINRSGILYILVTATSDNSSAAKIIKAAREAKLTKLPIQNTVDYVTSVFVPIVIAFAVVSGVYWLIIAMDLSGIAFAFSTFLCTLLIACPCALGLATPLTISISLSQALKNGILVKNTQSINKMHKVKTVIFDKTGTLTSGKSKINECIVSTHSSLTKDKLLILAGKLSQYSSHHLSKVLYDNVKSRALEDINLSDFHHETSSGLSGIVDNYKVCIGNAKWLEKNNINVESSLLKNNQDHDNQLVANTYLLIGVNQKHLGTVFFEDHIRSEAAQVINDLQYSNISVWIISGDNKNNTAKLAKKLKVKHYVAEASSENKAKYIQEIKNKTEGLVCMVGDGINDIGAFTESNVSIGINNNVSLAMDVSEIILVNNKLSSIPYLINLSHQTINNIKQNIVGAFIYNILCIPIAMGVLYPNFGIVLTPAWATIAMISSSLTVTLNSLRILWLDNYTSPKVKIK